MNEGVLITKADGSNEPFDPDKLRHSLDRAGASPEVREAIVSEISKKLEPYTKTQEIYSRAFALLRAKEDMPVAARYSLRRALLGFGPTGFPFEVFIAELYKARGFQAQFRAVVTGACAEHEVDLVAKKGDTVIGAELKFRNSQGYKTDLKTALYVRARFDDIANASSLSITEPYLITNTKFTSNAIQYGVCAKLGLIGWSYPRKGNLEDLINESGLHPITCLTTLSGAEKAQLLKQNIVLCRDVKERPEALRKLGISEKKIGRITTESSYLCQPAAVG